MSLFDVLTFITRHPANRDQKMRAVVDFFRWQIGSRLIRSSMAFEWVNGVKFLVARGEAGLTGNVYVGLHEFPDMAFLLHFLRPEDLFVDVGANLGSYTLLACGAVGANGIAFEPVPSTFARLRENVALNDLFGRTECLNFGVGHELGALQFTSSQDSVNHALATGEVCADAISVAVTTLDHQLSAKAPRLIKIDVEGYETPVIQGAMKTLAADTLCAVIMELNGSGARYGFDESRILATMLQLGFRPYSYDPISRTLSELSGQNQTEGNTIFVRNAAFVRERLAGARKFAIRGKSY